MKCSKEFIVAYNDLFNFLHRHGGQQEVLDFWVLLGDAILGRFKYLAKTEGLVGLLKYWSETLTAEGAKFGIVLRNYEDKEVLEIDMSGCPSLRKLQDDGKEVHEHYCDHCKILYGNALKDVGYEYHTGPRQDGQKGCLIWVTKKA